MTTTKRDLVLKISESTGLLKKDVAKIFQLTLDSLANEIAAGNTVELRNFGVFKTVMCKARIGRNPKCPAKDIVIPAHLVVKFLTGKELRTRIEALKTKNLK